jgi:hypothetical protein
MAIIVARATASGVYLNPRRFHSVFTDRIRPYQAANGV